MMAPRPWPRGFTNSAHGHAATRTSSGSITVRQRAIEDSHSPGEKRPTAAAKLVNECKNRAVIVTKAMGIEAIIAV